jgi:hypothetical protein
MSMRSFIIFMCMLGTIAGLGTMIRDGVSILILVCTVISFCSVMYLSRKG